jgi:hypothetical protein
MNAEEMPRGRRMRYKVWVMSYGSIAKYVVVDKRVRGKGHEVREEGINGRSARGEGGGKRDLFRHRIGCES